jgi:hypothetical protein
VINKRCVCGLARASFNLPGTNIGKWCSNCLDKPQNAIDVVNKRCVCGLARASFNLPGTNIGKWCSNCLDKPQNAIDVVTKRCFCGVGRASFNLPGQKAKNCSNCRVAGMVYQPRKKCIKKSCKELALYGMNNQRFHCDEHKTNVEFNLVERKCQSCALMEVLDKNNMCRSCDPTYFKQFIKRKEYHIKDLLDANGFIYVHNQISNGSECGRERPDFVFYFYDHIVILEVDEGQHKSYPNECERMRMFNITQSFGGLPVFWIRYNPDDFKMGNSKTKSAIPRSRKEKHLVDWLVWAFKREMKTLGEVIYLFYDGCDEKSSENDILTI